MARTDGVFTGSIPEIYDRYLVALIFEYYADDLGLRAAALARHAVLETAAGSGVVTRAVAAVPGPAALYVASDVNPPNAGPVGVDAAGPRPGRVRAHRCPRPAVRRRELRPRALSVRHDVLPRSHRRLCRGPRVLRPGGALVFNMWDRIDENEFADVVTRPLAKRFLHDPPRFLARTPHGHDDTARYRGELRAATDVTTDAIAERFGSGQVSGRIRGFVIAAR